MPWQVDCGLATPPFFGHSMRCLRANVKYSFLFRCCLLLWNGRGKDDESKTMPERCGNGWTRPVQSISPNGFNPPAGLSVRELVSWIRLRLFGGGLGFLGAPGSAVAVLWAAAKAQIRFAWANRAPRQSRQSHDRSGPKGPGTREHGENQR